MKIKLFYDGTSIEKYKSLNFIEGFTTNTSFVYQLNPNNYLEFIKDYITYSENKPCSFQIWSDNDDEIESQVKKICGLGNNVFAKVPIIKTDGKSNSKLIKKLLENNYKINITVIHTKEQIDDAITSLNNKTNCILSVFAGGITDTGLDPKPIVKYCVDRVSSFSNVEVLWAGCQTNLNINEAKECGCHIITVPDSILNKINRMGVGLLETSISKVNKFMDDAININGKF